MQKTEAAMILAGVQSEENREASAPTNLHVITGTVVETSESGKAKVSLDGLIFSADNEQSIEIDTLGGLEEGDTATILLSGESGHGMLPMAIGAGGSVDRVVERVKGIEADYVKATLLEAQVAQIGFLKADSATITQLQTETAKIQNLTAEQLSAATAYIAALTAGSITAESLTTDVAKIHNLTADQLSAAAGYISQLTADSVTAQNISAMYGDFATVKANAAKVANLTAQELEADHATISSLNSNYAHITNGVIDNATIGYADVNNLSAHYAEIQNGHINSALINTAAIVDEQVFTVTGNKATLASIDASKINVTNLNADNITVNKINGQTVTGKSISDALTQHETDISTKVDTTTFNNTIGDLNDRIDGAIETFTGTVVPTLNNTPASAWNTTDLRDEHVGDVYYVVNSSSQQNGYCYRFTKSGSTYSWQLIKDSDVTAALSRLQTAEGKITTFDSDISTLKTDTGELKTKTQSLETSLGDKVDVTTFNELSSDVEENSATITTLSNTVSQKADSSTVTTLSNTVNQVKQTADTNKTSITNLTQTVNQKADSSTVTTLTQRTSTIEQNLNGITTRVGKTESTLETVSNPNLTPWFSQWDDDYWHTIGGTDGAASESHSWTNDSTEGHKEIHYLGDGWAHVVMDSRESAGNQNKSCYINTWVRLGRLNVEEGEQYTWLAEVRNLELIKAASSSVLSIRPSIGNATLDKLSNVDASKMGTDVDAEMRCTVTAKDDFSALTRDTRGYMFIPTGCYAEFDVRVSLYEGEYTGPYKPYVDQTLSNRVKTAETSIEQNAEDITLRATKAEFDALSIGGRNLWGYGSECESLSGMTNNGGWNIVTESGYTCAHTSGALKTTKNLASNIPFVPKPNEIVTVSGYILIKNIVRGTTNPMCEFYLSGQTINGGWRWCPAQSIYIDGVLVPYISIAFDRYSQLSDEKWHHFAAVCKWDNAEYTANCSPQVYVRDVTGDVYVRHLKYERGNRATDWTPAPEDMATAAELKVANDNINLKVSKNDVINQINVSTEGALIKASKVEIDGTAVFKAANTIPDTRGTNENPQYYFTNYPQQSVTEFKQSSVMGLSGDGYCYVTTVTGWKDSSGGYPKQTAQIGNKTYWRVGTSNTAWGAWQETESTSGAQAKVNNLQASGDNLIGRFNLNSTGGATYDYITGKLTSTTTTNTVDSKAYLNAYNNGSAVRQIGSSFGAEYLGKLCHWTFEKASDFNQLRLKFNGNKADAYVIWDVASIPNGTSLVFSFMLDSISSDGKGNGGVMSEINLRVGNMPSRWSLAPEDSTLVGGRNLAVSTDRYLSTLNGSLFGGETISEAIPEGETITISVEVNADNVVWQSSGNKRIGCEFSLTKTSGGYQYIGVWAGSAVSPSYNITDVIEGGSIHKRISKTFVTLGTIVAGTNISLYMQAVSSGTVSVGRIKLERGSHATDWSPAPEDQEAYVDTKVGGRNYILRSAGLNVSGLGSAAGSRAEYRALNVGQSFMSIAHGTQVTISFDLYMTVNTANPTLNVYNTNNKCPKSFSNNPSGTGNYSGVTLNFTAAAGTVIDERVSVTGYINDRTSPTLTTNWLEFYSNYGTSNWFSISNLKMEIGSNATAWSPAPEDAVKRTQRIYYRKEVTGAPAAPSSWVVSSGDGSNAWTQKHISISSTDKYIYTCEQFEMADGTLGNTSILLDDTITVIDGGKILTGTVEANALNATSINASKSLTIGAFQTDTQTDILNSNVQVGGRNLLTSSSDISECFDSISKVTSIVGGYADPDGGNNAFLITPNATSWYAGPKGARLRLTKLEVPYTFSIWLRADNATQCKLCCRYMDSTPYSSTATRAVFDVTTEWQRFFISAPLKQIQNADSVWIGQVTTEPIYSYHPMVEMSSTPSDWTPAPEDTDSYISDSVNSLSEKTEADLKQLSTDLGGKYAALDAWKTTTDQDISTIRNSIAQDKAVRDNWINIDSNGIFVGDNSSDYGVGIDSNSVDFMVGKEKVAYASAEAFVPKALRLGDYVLSGDGAYLTIDYDPQE